MAETSRSFPNVRFFIIILLIFADFNAFKSRLNANFAPRLNVLPDAFQFFFNCRKRILPKRQTKRRIFRFDHLNNGFDAFRGSPGCLPSFSLQPAGKLLRGRVNPRLLFFAISSALPLNSVRNAPGSIIVAFIPCMASSPERASVIASRANLLAQ